ncbi:MAG: C25 family cysteine peptidase [Anaerolineae bacterium]|nr:C25 family cysteine peptidase [Anaerolineae bacterium]
MVTGQAEAVPTSFDWGSFSSAGSTTFGVYEGDNSSILATGDLVQLIWTGPDGEVDYPALDGSPGDDDVLLDSNTVQNGAPFPPPLRNKGYIPLKTYTFDTESPQANGIVYIRAWNAAAPADGVDFGESIPTTLVGGGTFNAPRWTTGTTLPVILAYVDAQRTDRIINFHWQTATEVGTVGFNIYGIDEDGSLSQLNKQMILATGVATVQPQLYMFEANTWPGSLYYIEDVGLHGETSRHGPFAIDRSHGRLIELQEIDWSAVQSEHVRLEEARQAESLSLLRESFIPEAEAGITDLVDIHVNQPGLQRITYADLVGSGIDLAGVRVRRIAVVNQGQAVPITVTGGNIIGPDTVFEFVGQPLNTLYSQTNVYTLQINPAMAVRVLRDNRRIPSDVPEPYYLATTTIERESDYSFLAPNGDPWYDTWMMAYGNSFEQDFDLPVDRFVADGPIPMLHINAYGLTDWPAPIDDHQLQVRLNDDLLADITFDGLVSQQLDLPMPTDLLQEGDNIVTLTVPQPVDPAILWDISVLNSYGITYPRAFVTQGETLTFTAAGAVFEVDGLASPDIVVYRVSAAGVARLQRLAVTDNGDGGYRVKFRGSPQEATYYVSSVAAITTPELSLVRPVTDITSGSADYLMIAHPSFIDGLAPLRQYHEDNGLVVKIVDVDDIYTQFGHGNFDPYAIQAYITHAVSNMGIQYVLLVGGDSYDYFDYLGLGSMSFIPSLYGPTEPYVSFAPLDPLYADIDGDQVPDVPIGRLPVRTIEELDNIISKTLLYAAESDQGVLMAADDGYKSKSGELVDSLPTNWTVTTAYLDDEDVATARQTVIDTINSGVRLTNFLGHSGPTTWTFDGLFSATDAAGLTNTTPTVVTQWGCWNTYHVDPAYDTLAHMFMLNEAGGAAAVLGASTLTQASSDALLGQRVLSQIAQPGQTIGQGIQAAKDDLAQTHPTLHDVLLGWTLLGDPALLVQP